MPTAAIAAAIPDVLALGVISKVAKTTKPKTRRKKKKKKKKRSKRK